MTDAGAIALALVLLINTGFIVGLAFLLFVLHKKLDELAGRMDPLIARGTEILGRVEQLAGEVQEKAQRVLEQTETLVERVSEKVDTTTAIAEQTISEPLIGAASVMAGISRGLKTLREQSEEKGDSN